MAKRIWKGTDIDIPTEATVPKLVFEQALRTPSAVAICDSVSGRTIDYRTLAANIRGIAASLRTRGLTEGGCVAIYAPNSPEWIMAALATMATGGVVTGASPLFKAAELARQLVLSKARFLF